MHDRICFLLAGALASVLAFAAVPGQVFALDAREVGTIELDGLEWMAASSGENLKWPDAVAFCDDLELNGHDDWRLPMLDELAALHDGEAEEGIRAPFEIGDCCLWSGESLVDRPAEDGNEIGGAPGMYHWGFMFDGGFPYYAVHIFEDGRAMCVRETG